MKAYVIKTVMGIYAFDEEGELIEKILFPKDANAIAEKLSKECEEERKIIEKLKEQGYKVKKKPKFLERIKIDKKLLHEVSLILAERKLKEKAKERDRVIIQAIEALDDLDESINLLKERFSEWKALPLEFGDIEKDFHERIKELEKFRKRLEKFVDAEMQKLAPNISAILGSTLGARLISLAGGLNKLALLPASRIQVLGAEKALFKHVIKGSKPPKHGVIFQHALIRNSPKRLRGKIARALATKIAIAAKADAFSKRYIGDELKKKLEARVKEIRQR